jgi:FkbM family methyltransferase
MWANIALEVAGMDTTAIVKQGIKAGLRRLGFEIRRIPRSIAPGQVSLGQDPFHDMRRLTDGLARPMVFDVGANVGQSIQLIRTYFDYPVIHAFEPAPGTFEQLREGTRDIPDLTLNKIALGHCVGTAEFSENTESVMSSFLELGPDGWGSIKRKTSVNVSTIDEYCAQNAVERIDILKLDTQGFDLEVLRGSERVLRHGRIGMVFTEITLSKLYTKLPGLDEIYRFLCERRLTLVGFYDLNYRNDRLSWCNALFAMKP